MEKFLFEIELINGIVKKFKTVQSVVKFYKNNMNIVKFIYKNINEKRKLIIETDNEFYFTAFENNVSILENIDNFKRLEYYLVWGM